MSDHKRKQSKRKNKNVIFPTRLIDNESVELVSSPTGPVQTLSLSQIDKEIILDRLRKEIVDNFKFSLSPENNRSRKRVRSDNVASEDSCVDGGDKEVMKTVLKSRFRVGINSCTRTLERFFHNHHAIHQNNSIENNEHVALGLQPDLVILARDIRPPNMLAHVPHFCNLLKIPILLLPGRASTDIGKVLGGKNTSIVMFLKRSDGQIDDEVSIRYHRILDSFLEFAKSKQPMSTTNS
jgi:hypothetical protein